jgi:hypothetical protein
MQSQLVAAGVETQESASVGKFTPSPSEFGFASTQKSQSTFKGFEQWNNVHRRFVSNADILSNYCHYVQTDAGYLRQQRRTKSKRTMLLTFSMVSSDLVCTSAFDDTSSSMLLAMIA